MQLPETSLCGLEEPTTLEFHHIEPQNHPNYPVVLEAKSKETRDAWLEVVKEHVIDTGKHRPTKIFYFINCCSLESRFHGIKATLLAPALILV